MFIAVIVLLLLMLAAEFFIGWRRGIKKSLVRLSVVAGMAVISLILTIVLANSLLLFIINSAGLSGNSLSEVFTSALGGVGLSSGSVSALSTAVSGLLVSVASPVLFLLFFWLLKLISWIVFAVVYKIRNNSTVREAAAAALKIETSLDLSAAAETENNSDSVKPQIVHAVKTDRRQNILGGLIGAAIGLVTVACVISFFVSDAKYIVEITPTALEIASTKEPQTKEDFDALIAEAKIVTDKVLSIGALSDDEKAAIAGDALKNLLIKIDASTQKVAETIKFDSIDTLKSDVNAIFDLCSWANENNLLVELKNGGENFITTVTKLGTEKLNELFDKLSAISFGDELIKKITGTMLTEAVGEEYSEKADEILSSFENPEELKAAIVEIVDVAPIIEQIESGALSDTEASAEIDEALEKIKNSPLIDSETYDEIKAKADELKANGFN